MKVAVNLNQDPELYVDPLWQGAWQQHQALSLRIIVTQAVKL